MLYSIQKLPPADNTRRARTQRRAAIQFNWALASASDGETRTSLALSEQEHNYKMIQDISLWLKSSIPGIVVLGALGSVLALVAGRLVIFLVGRVVPLPFQLHRRRRTRQAYFLGFAARLIYEDKTGRALVAYLAFQLSLFMIGLVSLVLSVSIFSALLAHQDDVLLTVGMFASITAAFLSLYWTYFQFDYIYRTYLFFWKEAIKGATETYGNREDGSRQGSELRKESPYKKPE